jgi:hypothetical protein
VWCLSSKAVTLMIPVFLNRPLYIYQPLLYVWYIGTDLELPLCAISGKWKQELFSLFCTQSLSPGPQLFAILHTIHIPVCVHTNLIKNMCLVSHGPNPWLRTSNTQSACTKSGIEPAFWCLCFRLLFWLHHQVLVTFFFLQWSLSQKQTCSKSRAKSLTSNFKHPPVHTKVRDNPADLRRHWGLGFNPRCRHLGLH